MNVERMPPKYLVAFAFVLRLIGTDYLSHSCLHVNSRCICDRYFNPKLPSAFAFIFQNVLNSESRVFLREIFVTMVSTTYPSLISGWPSPFAMLEMVGPGFLYQCKHALHADQSKLRFAQSAVQPRLCKFLAPQQPDEAYSDNSKNDGEDSCSLWHFWCCHQDSEGRHVWRRFLDLNGWGRNALTCAVTILPTPLDHRMQSSCNTRRRGSQAMRWMILCG